MPTTKRFQALSSREVLKALPSMQPDEVDASYEIIIERAKKAEMSLGDYIRATLDGKPTERPIPWVKFALGGTDDTVGPECKEFLKRPDILEYVDLPTELVEAVMTRLAEADTPLADVNRADGDILKEVRDAWRFNYDRQKRSRVRTKTKNGARRPVAAD